LYILDEPTAGLHAADVDKLMAQLDTLVAAGNAVIVVEHDMRVVAASDWVMDIGPGAGDEGGQVVAAGTPEEVANAAASRTASYLAPLLFDGHASASDIVRREVQTVP
jgi:excinuclease ABC subunit A